MKTLQKLKATLLLSAALCLLWTQSYAQEDTAYKPSPDSQSLLKSIQNPVNYYTGTVNVQAPLCNVNASGANVPVVLSYNTSGVKVNDLPTSTGIGWKLSAGGKITRIVKGYPDELIRHTYLSLYLLQTVIPDPYYKWVDFDMENRWINSLVVEEEKLSKLLESYTAGTAKFKGKFFDLDMEPDIFYFEIPGASGIFILDQNGVAHTIPHQDIYIHFNFNNTNQNTSFTIKDNSGNTYNFGNSESSREITTVNRYNWNKDETKSKVRDFSYTSTWWLDEIIPFVGDKVEFSYQGGTYVPEITMKDWYQAAIYQREGGNYEEKYPYKRIQYENNYETESIISPKYLKEIVWRGGKITFSYSKMEMEPSVVSKLSFEVLSGVKTFTYDNTLIDDINLHYSWFTNQTIKLDAVTKKYGTDTQCVYQFGYLDSIPVESYAFHDHWGFYNGRKEGEYNNFIPAINERTISISGHDRTPNKTYVRANMLRSVSTGSGMVVYYRYEPNTIATTDNGNKIFGGPRIQSILTSIGSSSQEVRYEYTLPNGNSSGKAYQNQFFYYDEYPDGPEGEKRIIVYSDCINNLYDFGGNHMAYSRVTEVLPNGSRIVYNFDEGTEHEDPKWEYISFAPALTPAQIERMGKFAPPTSYFWRRGLLTSQYTYDANGTQISRTENKYTFGTPKAVIECYVPYEKEKRLFKYKWVSEPVFLAKTKVYAGKYNLPTETVFTYNVERMLPIKEVTTDAEGNTYETRIQYSGDYRNVENSIITDKKGMLAAIKHMVSKNALSVPIEVVKYKNGKIVSANLNYYGALTNGATINGVVLAKEMSLHLKTGLSSSSFVYSGIQNTSTNSIFKYDSKYITDVFYDEYQSYLLLTTHDKNNIYKSTVYGYNNTLPVASVTNAVYSTDPAKNQVIYDSFETGANLLKSNQSKSGDYVLNGYYSIPLNTLKPGRYIVSYWRKVRTGTRADWEYVEQTININSYTPSFTLPTSTLYVYDELRIMPVNAQMITYSYRPGVGKISETDANGITIYYEYNKFRLLKAVRDTEGRIIKKIIYDNYTSNQ